jgi:hypothetical protein
MKNIYEVVKKDNGDIEVVTQIQKNGHWYTAATCNTIPNKNGMNAVEMANFIANKLNEHYTIQIINKGLMVNQRTPRFAN